VGKKFHKVKTEMLFLSDSVPKICEDCFDIIAEGKKIEDNTVYCIIFFRKR